MKEELRQKLCWNNTHWYINILFKNHVTNSGEAFLYEERHNIDKSFFSKVYSSSSLKSPIDRYSRKANVFSDFRFEDKINNF